MPKPTITSANPLTERLLIAAAVGIVGLLIVVPLASVFTEAFAEGPAAWWRALAHDPDTRHAIWLSLTVAPIACRPRTSLPSSPY